MFCVIQEIQLKKSNTLGAYKNLEVFTNPFNFQKNIPQYGYAESGERFERPIRTAYKISIHESKRVNGVVTKKQFVVTTVDYYHLADDWFALVDFEDKILLIAEKLNVYAGDVYDAIEAKTEPLEARIKAEFQRTEEYKTKLEHKRIISLYRAEKAKFAEMYECSEVEYDYCFNVFGELMNREYYEQIVSAHKDTRSYHENFYSSYSNFDRDGFKSSDGSYHIFGAQAQTYTADEKAMLKNFYKTLSKSYHPDVTKSDGREMQFIHKLKEAWGI